VRSPSPFRINPGPSCSSSIRIESTAAQRITQDPKIQILEHSMSTAAFSAAGQRARFFLPILVGGAIAGTLDLISAFITYGPNVPRGIAAGLIGRQAAFQGGPLTWILGVFLHYFIAFSAATVYCLAGRKLGFMRDHFVISGVFFGIGLYLVMKLIVVPLSGLHSIGPFPLRDLIQGLVVHMVIIGLPIAYSFRRLSAD
jgi:hypothetical protein